MPTKNLNAPMASPPRAIPLSSMAGQNKSATPTAAEKPIAPGASGKKLFVMENLRERRMMFDFLELSYKGGPRYKYGKDPKGLNVLIEHENERIDILAGADRIPTAADVVNKSESALKSDKYNRRTRSATYVNFVKPVEDKIHAYVFSVPPSRPKNDKIDARLRQIKIDQNIAEMLADGLRFEEAWIGFDAKKIVLPEGRTSLTKAEVEAQDPEFGGNPYIVRVDPRNVVDFSEEGGTITRVVIEERVKTKASISEPPTTTTFFREWTDKTWALYRLDKNANGEEELVFVEGSVHEFGCCPFTRVCVPFPTEDICDLNRQHFNVGSLLDEEMYQNTFSQRVITGVKAEDVKTTDRGAGNTIVLPDTESRVTLVSGDPAQSAALMDRLARIQQSIFELVSLNAVNRNVAESAEKKKRDLEPLYSTLSKIAEIVERAENWLLIAMEIYAKDDDSQRTKYSRKFDIYSIDDLISQIAELGKASFAPPSLKRRLSLALAQKIDPFGPHTEYEAEVEKMFDANPSIVDSMMSLKREGCLTPAMLVETLGVPPSLAVELVEIMDHPDPEPSDPSAPGGQSGSEVGEDAMPDMPGGSGNGPKGGGDPSGSGATPEADGGASGPAEKPNPGTGKAGRVRRRKAGGGGQ